MPVWSLVVIVAVAVCLGLALWLWPLEDGKMIGVVSGLLTGLILFVISLITQVYLVRKVARYERLGIVNLLTNRHDRKYYGPLLSAARKSVKVMGASATRFLEDFLDDKADEHVLLDALQTKPQFVVHILIPRDEAMRPDSLQKWNTKAALVDKLQQAFPGRFEVRRFPGHASVSFIITDEDGDFVGGPLLDTESKHGPAVHVKGSTVFAEKHNEFFENTWRDNAISAD